VTSDSGIPVDPKGEGMMQASQDQEQGDRPEPKSVVEAFARINRTVNEVSATAHVILHSPTHEYDQGDAIALDYDKAFDLAEAFFMLLRVARELESDRV
jgi:hypothetical protein